jgi:hypothetical protein
VIAAAPASFPSHAGGVVDRPRPPHNAPFASYKVSRASTALHHATALPSSERYRMRSAARNQLLTHLRPLKRNPHTGHLFVFRGRRGSLIKLLWQDGQGMCLFAPAGARVWLATGHTDMRKGFDGLASLAPAAATRSSAPLALHQGPDQRRHCRTAQPLNHRDQRRHIGGVARPSALTLSRPRRRNWRKPRACLIWPNTGSTICFRTR